jgi:hypothetical protein
MQLLLQPLEPINADDSTVTWSVDNSAVGTIDANGLLQAISNGDVVVIATANDGSGIFGSKTITISNQTNDVNDIYRTSVNVYPNPATHTLNIISDHPVSEVRVLNICGQVVDAQNLSSSQLNINALEAGIYFVEIQINDSWSRHKFIKK